MSRTTVNVIGVVKSVSLHKETNALVTYKVEEFLSKNVYELVCLRYRSEDKDGFAKTHMKIKLGDVVDARGILRKRSNGTPFVSVTRIFKVDESKVSIPSIPLTLYNDRFVYQGETFRYGAIDLSLSNHMTIRSQKRDVTIEIAEQGFEHVGFFIKANKYENKTYDMMENIPYHEIARVICGDNTTHNDFSEIPLEIKPDAVYYRGVKFVYESTEMNRSNKVTLRLREPHKNTGPKIVLTRQGPGHVGATVYQNEYEKIKGDAYCIMLNANYDDTVSGILV
jgi:hypothetical protein